MLNPKAVEQIEKCFDLRTAFPERVLFCRWHDDRTVPNLHLYPDHAYCFACGKYVPPIEVLMQYKQLKYPQAVHYMAERRSLHTLPERGARQRVDENKLKAYQEALPQTPQAVRFLEDRGISLLVAQAVGLGTTGGTLVIPHLWQGEVYNLKYRLLPEREREMQAAAKYGDKPLRYFSQQGCVFPPIYYPLATPVSAPCVVLCEGELDWLILYQAGIPAVSVASGVNSFGADAWKVLADAGVTRCLCAFDIDEAGERAAEKLSPPEGIELIRVRWPKSWGKDVGEARESLLPRLVDAAL